MEERSDEKMNGSAGELNTKPAVKAADVQNADNAVKAADVQNADNAAKAADVQNADNAVKAADVQNAESAAKAAGVKNTANAVNTAKGAAPQAKGSVRKGGKDKSRFLTSANIIGLIFIAILIAFNLVIYFGSSNTPGGGAGANNPRQTMQARPDNVPGMLAVGKKPVPGQSGPDVPVPGVPVPGKPVKPVPGVPVPGKPQGMFSNQILYGLIYLSRTDDSKLRLTEEQAAKGSLAAAKLVSLRGDVVMITSELLSYFTPEQLSWARENRGEPKTEAADNEHGYQPVVAAALKTLESTKASSSGKLKQYKHRNSDLLIHDIACAVLNLQAQKDLALTPQQAAAIYPIFNSLAEADQKCENAISKDLGGIFTAEQKEWLGSNMDTARIDFDTVLLLYAGEMMSGRSGNSASSAALDKAEKDMDAKKAAAAKASSSFIETVEKPPVPDTSAEAVPGNEGHPSVPDVSSEAVPGKEGQTAIPDTSAEAVPGKEGRPSIPDTSSEAVPGAEGRGNAQPESVPAANSK